jgi:DNA-binding NarL/FixJ family response regulator
MIDGRGSHAVNPWPFVGRHVEVERCLAALGARDVRVVGIHGPAGVGKSRLADEVARRSEEAGRPVLRSQTSPGAVTVPLGALVHLLPRPLLEAPVDGPALYAAAVDVVGTTGPGEPPLLVVDDLQWLDTSSAVLVGQLLTGGHLMLVGTVRSGEPVSEAVAALWQRADAFRVDLDALTESEVDSMLHLALGAPVHARLAGAIWEASSGNPMFVRELVLGARAGGQLVERRGVWWLAGELMATPRLTEAIEHRLVGLPEPARRALQLLAVWEPLGLAELDATYGSAALDALDRAEMIQLRVDGRRQQVTLAHPLYGEVVRRSLSTLGRRQLLLAQADRIEAHGSRRRDDPLRVAMARLEATGTAEVGLLVGAARIARHGHDHELVARLTEAALGDGWHAEAVLLRAEALHELGHYDDVERLLAAAPREIVDDPDHGVRIIAMRVRNLMWGLRRPRDALAVNREARSRPRPVDELDELVTDEALTLLYSNRPRQAIDSLAQMSTDPTPRARVLLAITEIPSLIVIGRCEDALAEIDVAQPLHRGLQDQSAIAHPGVHTVYRMHALTEAGRLAEAYAIAERGYRRANVGGPPLGRDWFAIGLGRIALLEGRPRTARRWLAEAAVLSASPGFDGPHRLELSLLAVAEAWLADAAAASTAEEVRNLPPAVFLPAEQQLGLAWSKLADGDPQEARSLLAAAADEAQDSGHRTSESWLRHDLLRLGNLRQAGRLAELADDCQGALVPAYAAHAAALSRRDPVELDECSRRFEALGMALLAAEAATEAADNHRRAGSPRSATASTKRAVDLLDRCEGARTPALVSSDVIVPLTDREREVAAMAARGLASRDIASRLSLSPRTVENHLQRIYAKLGITNRAELADTLTRAE